MCTTIYRIKDIIYVEGFSVEPMDCPICGNRPSREASREEGLFWVHRLACCGLTTRRHYLGDLSDEVALIEDWNVIAADESDRITYRVTSSKDYLEWVRLAKLTRKYSPQNKERIRSYLEKARECRGR